MDQHHAEKQKTSPKDFFLHLLSIVTLYVSAISLGTVLFQVVNLNFPDPAAPQFSENSMYVKDTLRNALSLVIVFFPVYVGSVIYLAKLYQKDSHKRDLRVRRWLIYFTLFVAVIVILSSLATLVYHLLGGELTTRFFLKLLSVVAIASGVLGFYGWDIKKHKTE